MDMNSVPSPNIEHIDKVYHGKAYYWLTITWYLFFYKKFIDRQGVFKIENLSVYLTWSPLMAIGSAVLCVFIGGSLELIQEWFTENRTMDVWDMVANLSGIVIAVVSIAVVSKLYQHFKRTKAEN